MHIDAHRCQSSFIFHRQACNSVHISTLSTTRALLLFHCQMMLRPASKHTNFVWVSRLIFSVTHTETFCETYKYTRTHTHASSQWWITCNGLPQILLCPCIKCQNRSNVMSLSNCSLSRSLWLTLLHTDRTKVDFTTDWLWVGGVSMCMHTHTIYCQRSEISLQRLLFAQPTHRRGNQAKGKGHDKPRVCCLGKGWNCTSASEHLLLLQQC